MQSCNCDDQPKDKTVYWICPVHGNMVKGGDEYLSGGLGYVATVQPKDCNCDEHQNHYNSWKCPYHDHHMIRSGHTNIQVPDRSDMKSAFEYTHQKVFRDQVEINFKGHEALRLIFTDGTSVVVQSEYEEDLSDVTSGQGIMSPSFYIISHKVYYNE